ncbi:MAG: hypothetical protein WCO00_12880 [Rhodospirillaceae bacterium]
MTYSVPKPRLGWLLGLAAVAVLIAGVDHQALAEAAHGESQAGLPQFDAAFFLTQLFWLALIFGTFYLIVQGVAVPKVVQMIETRDALISHDFKRAEEARNQAAAVNKIMEDKIIQVRDHARTILFLASREAEHVTAARLAMFDARIAGKVRDAEQRIFYARENALREMPDLAGALAGEVVVRFCDEEVKPALITSAVTRAIAERRAG